MNVSLKGILREPLLHFLCIGLLIFAVDRAVSTDAKSARVIVIDKATQDSLIDQFTRGHGRLPNPGEMDALYDAWVYDEVMYREAVALGLDKGDEMFRSRLELKMRAVLIDNAVVDAPTDDQLKQWLDENRDKYSAPRRFDFVEFKVEGDDRVQGVAEALAAQMIDGAVTEDYAGQALYYNNRTRESIVETFGEAFAKGLLDPGDTRWHAIRAKDGWYVARVEKDKPAVEPDFAALKSQLKADWEKAALKRKAQDAYKALRARYDIRVEGAAS